MKFYSQLWAVRGRIKGNGAEQFDRSSETGKTSNIPW